MIAPARRRRRARAVSAAVIAAVALAGLGAGAGCGSKAPSGPLLVLEYAVAPDDDGGTAPSTARDAAIAAVRQRLDRTGLRHLAIRPLGEDGLRIELSGSDIVLAQATAIVERRADLGIHRVDDGSVTMERLSQRASDDQPAEVLAERDVWTGPDGDLHEDRYLSSSDRDRLEAWIQTAGPSLDAAAALADERRIVLEQVPDGNGGRRWRTYLIDRRPILSGADVREAEVQFDSYSMRPQVRLVLHDQGRERFGQATREALGHKLAIVLDGRVTSAPVVQSPIPGGEIVITMGQTDTADAAQREAEDLVAVLRAGAMPRLRRVRSEIVGGTR